MPFKDNIKTNHRRLVQAIAKLKIQKKTTQPRTRSRPTSREQSTASLHKPHHVPLQRQSPSRPWRYVCDICDRVLETEEALREHHRSTICGTHFLYEETTLVGSKMDLEDLTLSDEYKRCIDNYDELLDALSSQTCYIVSRNLVDRQQVSENYSRLEVWGEQTKLHMLDGSQSFLEEILKTHYQLMNTIRTALRRLTGLLRKVQQVARMVPENSDDPDHSLIDSTSDDSASTNSQETQSRSRRVPKITILVRHIFDQVQTLYEASSVLRRLRLENMNLQSSAETDTQSSAKARPQISDGPDPTDMPHLTTHWPTAKALQRRDRIFFSNGEPEVRIVRLQLELFMWASLLKQYQEGRMNDSVSLEQDLEKLKREIEERVIDRAKAVTVSNDDIIQKRQILIQEAAAMIDSLPRVGHGKDKYVSDLRASKLSAPVRVMNTQADAAVIRKMETETDR